MNAIPRIPPLITIPHIHHNISQNLILLLTDSATINPTLIRPIIHTTGLDIPLNNDPKN